MGKYSNMPRRKHDAYYTPKSAVLPLLAHLPRGLTYIEPCAGDGRLVQHLAEEHPELTCTFQGDIDPKNRDVSLFDALQDDLPVADMIITNPPWTRPILHDMIERFRNHAPTWVLFDADWLFTKQAVPFLPYLHKVITVGRVSWMENGNSGKENAAWYHFQRSAVPAFKFIGKGETCLLSA